MTVLISIVLSDVDAYYMSRLPIVERSLAKGGVRPVDATETSIR
jgi:Mg2+/citrate symporter